MRNELEVQVAKAVADVRSTNPQGWTTLLDALSARALFKAEECISSPIERLQVAQGRAQEARELLSILQNAPKLAEQIRDKERINGARRTT